MEPEKNNAAAYIETAFRSFDKKADRNRIMIISFSYAYLMLSCLLRVIMPKYDAYFKYAAFAVAIFNFCMGVHLMRLSLALNTFHQYATYIWEGDPCSVSFLSEKTGMTEKKIMKDMEKLRKAGLLPKGTHFDQENATFFFENEERRTVKTPGTIEQKKD